MTLRIAISLSLFIGSNVVFGQSTTEPPKRGRISQLANVSELREKLGLLKHYADTPNLSLIKIAVLDYGFDGLDKDRPCLPATAQLIEQYDPELIKKFQLGNPEFTKGFEPGNAHGRFMAQSIWATTNFSFTGPQFYLLNANGPTMFRRAIRQAIDLKVDIILFSGHFEGGGNYDGKGSINAAVTEAIKSGIIWINAAGNHHGRVYNGPVTVGNDGYVLMGKTKQSSISFLNRLDENTFTITLSWNDYHENEDAGTLKDLDLILEDSEGREIAKSALKQIPGDRTAGESESKNPRERFIVPDLSKGTYRLRVKANSNNFTATDRLRILLSPSRSEPCPHPDLQKMVNPVQFVEATNEEELFPPADHPRVITVGEQSEYSAMGPSADRRVKPDVLLPTVPAKWSNGEVLGGTSYAAAYYAGVVAILKANRPDLTTDELMRWIRKLRTEAQNANKDTMTQSNRTVAQKVPALRKPEPTLWRTPSVAELAGMKN